MTPFEHLTEKLSGYTERPFCIRLGRRDWADLRRDPAARKAMSQKPGDPMCIHNVPVRIERGRISGIPAKFDALIYRDADELHEAIYG